MKILIVEDDLPTLELMCEYLKAEDVLVEPQSDPQLVAKRIAEDVFDLVLLDLQMPKFTGLELAQIIRRSSKNSRAQIAMITGRRERHILQDCFEAGATWFLSKPVDRKKLIRLVRSALGAGGTQAKPAMRQNAG